MARPYEGRTTPKNGMPNCVVTNARGSPPALMGNRQADRAQIPNDSGCWNKGGDRPQERSPFHEALKIAIISPQVAFIRGDPDECRGRLRINGGVHERADLFHTAHASARGYYAARRASRRSAILPSLRRGRDQKPFHRARKAGLRRSLGTALVTGLPVPLRMVHSRSCFYCGLRNSSARRVCTNMQMIN
jgi:hypothetical protein